jgi:hypothetical protein
MSIEVGGLIPGSAVGAQMDWMRGKLVAFLYCGVDRER